MLFYHVGSANKLFLENSYLSRGCGFQGPWTAAEGNFLSPYYHCISQVSTKCYSWRMGDPEEQHKGSQQPQWNLAVTLQFEQKAVVS